MDEDGRGLRLQTALSWDLEWSSGQYEGNTYPVMTDDGVLKIPSGQ